MLSHVWLFVIPWTVSHKLLCPWDFPGKNTGVDCHFLLHLRHWLCLNDVRIICGVTSVTQSLQPHGLQHARPPCPSPTPSVYSNSCPLSWWCHPTSSSSVIPFSSHLQTFPASGSFPVSQSFPSGDQSIGASALASILPKTIQDWFPLGYTGRISLQSEGLPKVFSDTKVQKHQLFGAQLSSQSNSHIHIWPLEKP